MTTANFEYPISLYGDRVYLEDWLANFYVEESTVSIETLPQEVSNIHQTTALAVYLPTKLGELLITREMLVAMFSEKDVLQEELNASIAFLDGRL